MYEVSTPANGSGVGWRVVVTNFSAAVVSKKKKKKKDRYGVVGKLRESHNALAANREPENFNSAMPPFDGQSDDSMTHQSRAHANTDSSSGTALKTPPFLFVSNSLAFHY